MTTDSRIESLETQVRTLKRMLFGVFGLVVVGGLLAATSLQSVPDVIQAKKFEVVNDKGKVVSTWHYDYAGGWFTLRDETGSKAFLTLECLDDTGGLLKTQNGKGQELVRLGVTVNGEGMVVTANGKGQELVTLGAMDNGEGITIRESSFTCSEI